MEAKKNILSAASGKYTFLDKELRRLVDAEQKVSYEISSKSGDCITIDYDIAALRMSL